MQSRLAITAVKLNRRLICRGQKAQRLGCATTSGRTADPAEHAVDHDEVSPTEAIHDEQLRHAPEPKTTTKDGDPYVPSKSPLDSAPKIGSSGVGPQTDPTAQQRRRISTPAAAIEGAGCAAIDEGPWPEEVERETDRRTQREKEEEDDREYFKHHKASPLSEIEIADTRKPITRATDGTAGSGTGGSVWRPEQLDSVDDSLRRAAEMFRRSAVRGDPDSPHGRVLRKLRGEYW